MMKTKRTWIAIVALSMLCGTLAGCCETSTSSTGDQPDEKHHMHCQSASGGCCYEVFGAHYRCCRRKNCL